MALSNTQYNTLIRRYEARQLENQHIVMERMNALYPKFPRLMEIDETISSQAVAHAKKFIEGDEGALAQLKLELSALAAEKREILRSHGYPENYFDPPYQCPDCKDTGYIGREKCHCFRQAAIDLIYTQSNLRQILEQENFENFSYDYYSDTIKHPSTGLTSLATVKQAVSLCKSFISGFDTEFRNLFFYGDTGIGKTYLSNCVAKELLNLGHSVIYFTASSLFHIFEKSFFGKEASYSEDYQNIFDCSLLIIDDLGTELSNAFTSSQLFLCINERILRRKSTIISTNLSLGQLVDTYSERIFSRISSNYTLINLFGNDIRLQKKLGQSRGVPT